MTLVAPRRFGIAAFVLGLVPALALAQTAPAPRAWTDPPAREAAPTAEAPRPAEKTARASDVKAAPAPRAAVRPIRAARTASAHPAPRAKVTAHPTAARRLAATSPRLRGPNRDPAVRVVTMRAAPYAGPPVRYGYVVEAAPARPMTHGNMTYGSMAYEDMRAARIRRAEEAGYIVVRSRSVEFPDGRRLRTYRPLDEDADD